MQTRARVGGWLHGLANKVGGRYYGGPTASIALSVVTPDIRPAECDIESSKPYASDWLGREEFGAGLERLTRYGSGSGVVLIDGKWGTGKTTFIRMWSASLRNDDRTVVEVNAWAGDHADAPFDDIVRQFERGLRESHRSLATWSRRIARVMIGGVSIAAPSVSWLTSLAGKFDASGIGAIAMLIQALHGAARADRGLQKRIDRLKRRLSAVAKYYWKRRRKSIVLVIDELDRCRPDYALRFLETLKHVFEVPHVTFVVAANAQELGKAVKGVYGEDFDGVEYVERFFDIWLPLPVGDRRQFVERCLAEHSFKAASNQDIVYTVGEHSVTADKLAGDLLEASRLSPRQIKKAIKHVAITLLFNRSDSGALERAIAFLGLVRHTAADRYQAINDEADPNVVAETLISSTSWAVDDAGSAKVVTAVVEAVWSDAGTLAVARRALEGYSVSGLSD